MNDNRDPNERLLDEILGEVTPADFRKELLGRTLKQARRRKRSRQRNQTLFILAAATATAWITLHSNTPRKPVVTTSANISRKSSASAAIDKPSLSDLLIITDAQFPPVDVVVSTPANTTIIETRSAPHEYHELDDRALLNLMDGAPAVLVETDKGREELLVADAAGEPFHLVGEAGQ